MQEGPGGCLNVVTVPDSHQVGPAPHEGWLGALVPATTLGRALSGGTRLMLRVLAICRSDRQTK
jgi:hypothetical protein